METYILKFSACLAVFWLVYVLVLERLSIHRFKRFYLLASFALSLAIPALTITEYIEPIVYDFEVLPSYIPMDAELIELPAETTPWLTTETVLWFVYIIGVLLFSIRFAVNLYRLSRRISKNPKHKKQSFIYVLLSECRIPHSFFKYIFVNQQRFEEEHIPQEVILHEETHAKQLHSLDILLVEFLQIVFWFHPLVYILKHHIKLNHEFLADEAVIRKGSDTKAYQNILLQFSSSAHDFQLTSAINYSSIKKRFTVMKTQTSKTRIWLSSLLLLPIIAILFYSFAEREYVEKENSEIVSAIKEELKEADKLNMQYVGENSVKVYLNKYETYESLRTSEPHYIQKPEEEKQQMDVLFSDLGGMYFRMSKENKAKVKRPISPIKPFVQITLNGKTYYKKRSELTAEEIATFPPPPPPPAEQNQHNGGPNIEDTQEIYNPSFLEYIVEMEQLGASFYLDDEKISAEKAKSIAKNHDGKRTEMTTQKDSNGNYVVKLSSTEKNKIYARSIELKILNDNSYLIDGIKATKKTFVDVFNQLHQDITPEVRNNVMNIHVKSSKEISNKELWFIYNSLQDYGFYRIVTPNQEINRAKGNTPFAIESHISTQQKATKKQIAEYNAWAKKMNAAIKKAEATNNKSSYPIIKKNEYDKFYKIYRTLMSEKQRENAEPWPNIPPPPPPPPPAPETPKVKKGSEVIPPPPPPPPPAPESTLDFVIRMAKANAKFFNEGKVISSDEAIALIKKNDKLNINAQKTDTEQPLVYITKEPIQIGSNDKVGGAISKPQQSILPKVNGKTIKIGKLKMTISEFKKLELSTEVAKVTGFKIKIPGVATEFVQGNTITKTTISNLDKINHSKMIAVFDIKDEKESNIAPLIIELIE